MNNQEPQNQDKTTVEASVDKKRRRFVTGASVAAPVILTFASPMVFGGPMECYSQQMSGNASGTPASCNTGLSPASWLASPTWPTYTKGTKPASGCDYTGGTTFDTAFPGDTKTKVMSYILCKHPGSTAAYYVAAILNAQTPGFVLTVDQVRGLRKGTYSPPPGFTELTFLQAICID